MKKGLAALLAMLCLIQGTWMQAAAAEVETTAPSVVLIEEETGTVLYEKDADTRRPPASVTKVMTLLLIFDALEAGTITQDEMISVSEYAASMGGSQVYLEPGEEQSVDTMLKCIAVASANDACVAMAERISGSEAAFVELMNARAKELGMEHTTFQNCNGLDANGHLTTARDIALMSRELLRKHPEVLEYCQIWMDTIIHKTRKGESEFGLSNTNKLLKHYNGITGLKTGSTSQAKFCISATAKRNDLSLIAVVMAAPDPKTRSKDATTLLDYGFSVCQKYVDENTLPAQAVPVRGGTKSEVSVQAKEQFSYIETKGRPLEGITSKLDLKKSVKAPVKQGEELGRMRYLLDGEEIGSVPFLAMESVEKMNLSHAFLQVAKQFAM